MENNSRCDGWAKHPRLESLMLLLLLAASLIYDGLGILKEKIQARYSKADALVVLASFAILLVFLALRLGLN